MNSLVFSLNVAWMGSSGSAKWTFFRLAGSPAVNLACRKLDQPLLVPQAGLGDFQVLREIEPEYFQRNAQVEPWVGVGDQIDHQIRIADVGAKIECGVADVLPEKLETRVIQIVRHLFRGNIHGGDVMPFLKQPVRKMRANETRGAQG